MTTDDLIAQGRALLARATPVPWAWRWKSSSLHRVGETLDGYGGPVMVPVYDRDTGVAVEISDEDADLIAFACNHLPRLLDELEAAREALKVSAKQFDFLAEQARAAIAKAEGRTDG